MSKTQNRRSFLCQGGAFAAASFSAFSMPAASYARVLGANQRLNIAVMGIRSRGRALIDSFLAVPHSRIVHICDVDERVLASVGKELRDGQRQAPTADQDVRRTLGCKDVDALAIATPDHWHAPAAIMALQAGKHVYIEKPCGHNPHEGELLVQAQRRYGKVVQMGNQQRSSRETRELMELVRAGRLGRVYHVETWYANKRKSIGNGKQSAPPRWLNWKLWQGPAPRRAYYDNLVHYNWHWFWHWGTGETCNNATHEIDVARWALGEDYPERVETRAARNFYTTDDWQMYDTMHARFHFPGNKTVTWEGHSCNNVKKYGRGRGALLYGTQGAAIVDRDGYEIFDLEGNRVRTSQGDGDAKERSDTANLVGQGGLTDAHVANFVAKIRDHSVIQNSPIDEGHKSTLLCHLANIAYRAGGPVVCDPKTGRIKGRHGAQFWQREYERGWEPAALGR